MLTALGPSAAAAALLACIALLTAGLGTKRVCAALIRWRAERLPPCEDAERAREELEGFAEDFSACERAELAANILARARAIHAEIGSRAAERMLAAPEGSIAAAINPTLGVDWPTLAAASTLLLIGTAIIAPNVASTPVDHKLHSLISENQRLAALVQK